MIDDDPLDLLEEDQALSGYFDALLGSNSDQNRELDLNSEQQKSSQSSFAEDNKSTVVVEPAIVTPLPEPLELDEDIEEIELPDTVADIFPVIDVVDIETRTAPVVEEHSEIPDWARHEFQCVSFMVRGLKLVVPLSGLSQVYALQEHKVKAIFGQADWFIGMMKPVDHSINVIDAAHWLLPENNQQALLNTGEKQEYEFILAFEGSSWGVACDDLGFSEFLKSDDINWHNKDPKRPWLAGVVIERMCGLLDPEQFVKFLNSKSQGLPLK